jgi:predicted site-specific integrase-resolvase
MDKNEAVSTHKAAEILGVSYRTIQEWLKHGRFPHAYKLDPLSTKSSPLRIPMEDIEAIQNKRQNGYRTI